ncbi:uncharacterized protein LOC110037655, partial [Phalaenopsis equestris]|uniref:uncharacterized protein LOC110037655 n=1 Tax=Phalaenopsis equestris TaxID=78828 RepID=UPI0009E30843
ATDDLPIDGNLEVTEDDMNDPEIGDALKSFGWSEEDDNHEQKNESESVPFNQEAVQAKILNLKKEALSQKRAGNVPEAMALLKKAKLLEQDLSDSQMPEPGFSQKTLDNQIHVPKSKMVIQKELLVLKKKALTLRREGRVDEADEELKKGKLLEQQLEEFENTLKKPVMALDMKHVAHAQDSDIGTLDLGVDSAEPVVTDQDMHDPTMLSALKNLGWIDDESVSLSGKNFTSKPSNSHSVNESVPTTMPWMSMRNKGEIQRELLAIKRKALSLRRQGKTEEAAEELEKAKDLEKRLADLETQSSGSLVHSRIEVARTAVPVFPELDQNVGVSSKQNSSNSENVSYKVENTNSKTSKTDGINGYKEEILSHKRNALVLKREGKLMEAKEELRKAKLLEKTIEESQESSPDDKPALVSTSGHTSTVQENSRTHLQKPISSRD